MRSAFLTTAAAFAAMCAACHGAVEDEDLATRAILAGRAVVKVTACDERGRAIAEGSGFFISDKVVTARHLLYGAARVRVETAYGRRHNATAVAAERAAQDVVILEIDAPAAPTAAITGERARPVSRDRLVIVPAGGADDAIEIRAAERRWVAFAGDIVELETGFPAEANGAPVLTGGGALAGMAVAGVYKGRPYGFAVSLEEMPPAGKITPIRKWLSEAFTAAPGAGEFEKGLTAAWAGDWLMASRHFKDAAEADRKNPVYLLSLASALRKWAANPPELMHYRRNWDEISQETKVAGLAAIAVSYGIAAKVYEEGLKLMPEAAWAHADMGRCYRFLGDHEKALAAAGKAIEVDPEEPAGYEVKGLSLLALKRYGEALAPFEKALELRPDDAHTSWGMGFALFRLTRFREACKWFEDALEKDPSNAEAMYWLASAHHELKEYEEAIRCFKRTMEMNPRDLRAANDIGNAYRTLGRHEEAMAAYRDAIRKRDGDYAFTWRNVGLLEEELGNLENAVDAYRKAAEQDPDWALPRLNLGRLLYRMKRYAEAVEALEEAAALEEGNPENHYELARALHDLKRYGDAAAAARRALEIRPDHSEAQTQLARSLWYGGDREAAMAAVEKAVALGAPIGWPHNVKGYFLMEMERYEEAIGQFEKALEIEPGYAAAMTNMGETYYRMRRYGEALSAYNKAAAMPAPQHRTFCRKALVCNRLKRYWEALEAAEKAIELSPTCSASYRHKGKALLNLGKFERARTALEESLELNENDETTHYLLGTTCLALGDREGAREQYRALLKMGSSYAGHLMGVAD